MKLVWIEYLQRDKLVLRFCLNEQKCCTRQSLRRMVCAVLPVQVDRSREPTLATLLSGSSKREARVLHKHPNPDYGMRIPKQISVKLETAAPNLNHGPTRTTGTSCPRHAHGLLQGQHSPQRAQPVSPRRAQSQDSERASACATRKHRRPRHSRLGRPGTPHLGPSTTGPADKIRPMTRQKKPGQDCGSPALRSSHSRSSPAMPLPHTAKQAAGAGLN